MPNETENSVALVFIKAVQSDVGEQVTHTTGDLFCCDKKENYYLITYFGKSCPTNFSVLFLSTSSSSVRSLIRSSRLELYCSNIRNMESMMFALFPLLIPRNCKYTTQAAVLRSSYFNTESYIVKYFLIKFVTCRDLPEPSQIFFIKHT